MHLTQQKKNHDEVLANHSCARPRRQKTNHNEFTRPASRQFGSNAKRKKRKIAVAEMAVSVGEFVQDNGTESWSLTDEPCPALPYRTKVQGFDHNEVKLDCVVDSVAQLQERVALLEERFKKVQVVEANANAGGSRPSQAGSSLNVQHSASIGDRALPAEPAALTKQFLDEKASISMAESMWDACLFVGLPCIGHDVSLVIVFVYMLNLVLQLGFTVVVFNTLLADPLGPEDMDELLHFRLGAAHDAQYANRITSSSMLSEVCDVVGSLHTSAEQTDLYDNLQRFTSGGVFLCLLAQIA